MDGQPFSAITRCPMCGGPLDEGHVIPGRGLAWNMERVRLTLGSEFEWISSPVCLTYDNFLARRCTACKLILMRYR